MPPPLLKWGGGAPLVLGRDESRGEGGAYSRGGGVRGFVLYPPRVCLPRSPGFIFLDHHHDNKVASTSLTCVSETIEPRTHLDLDLDQQHTQEGEGGDDAQRAGWGGAPRFWVTTRGGGRGEAGPPVAEERRVIYTAKLFSLL